MDAINARAFDTLSGDIHTFTAFDEGPDVMHGWSCAAPAVLHLRVGCSVLLLKNLDLSLGLCNGRQGVVTGFECDADGAEAPLVAFGDHPPRLIARAQWSSVLGNQLRARRTQIPLTLAYALTIHRAQGMQLESVLLLLLV